MKNYLFASLFIIIGLIVGLLLGRNLAIRSTSADKVFLEQMIPHHEEAIQMAKLELENGQSSELKDMANNIITDQTKEINQMKDWYREWYGVDYKAETTMAPESIGSGTPKGKDTDREFAALMIMHHQSAVSMAKMIEQSTKKSGLKDLADNIVNAQQQEIAKMEQIRNTF